MGSMEAAKERDKGKDANESDKGAISAQDRAACEVHPGTADTSYAKQHQPSPKPPGLGTSIPSPAGKHPGFNIPGTHLGWPRH